MRWMKTGVAVLALVSASAHSVEAQQRAGRGHHSIRPQGVEQILRARETLNLSQGQIAELDALRREALERRTAETAERMRWRSRVSAGDATPQEMRDALATRREAARARAEDYRTRLDAVLTEEQRAQLPALRMRTMAGRRGFHGRNPRGFRGPGSRGVRPGRGFRNRGPGWNRGSGRARPGRPGFRRGSRRPQDGAADAS